MLTLQYLSFKGVELKNSACLFSFTSIKKKCVIFLCHIILHPELLLWASWCGGLPPRWVVQSRLLFVPYAADRDWGAQLEVCRFSVSRFLWVVMHVQITVHGTSQSINNSFLVRITYSENRPKRDMIPRKQVATVFEHCRHFTP